VSLIYNFKATIVVNFYFESV